MSKKFLDYNPSTGLVTTTAYEDGKNYVRYEQDVEPFFDFASQLRSDTERTRQGMKDELLHAAFVPDVVIIDMLQRFGVNFYDKAQQKRVVELIETEYPKCKTTEKKLFIRR